MPMFAVQITCVKQFTIEADTPEEAEQQAYSQFDAAPFGNFNTDHVINEENDHASN